MTVIFLLVSIILVIIDQIIKTAIVNHMELFETVSIIKFGDKEIFNFTYVLNDGAGWSILKGKTLFLVIFTSILIIAIIVYLFKFAKRKPLLEIALTLFIGGGIGNLFDRIFRGGKVIDFIETRFIDFPVFNFADICVTVGVIILAIYFITSELSAKKMVNKESENTNGQL